MAIDKTTYFAAADAKDAAGVLLDKAHQWFHQLITNGYLDKLRTSWQFYHGSYYNGDSADSHAITFSGEQGELTNLAINHYRNIADHMITMITSNRPAMQARATNTDYKSLVQTKLGNNLLEYYMREKRLEQKLTDAVIYAVVLGSGYVQLEWNPSVGEVYDYDEETGSPIYEGDLQFFNLSPFDVVVDSYKEDDNHDWILVRKFKNRFAVAAKYPELRDQILALPTKNELYRHKFVSAVPFDETDDIPVYEFFHKKDESVPEGRHIIFLDKDIVLVDVPLLYSEIPIYKIQPSRILGSPYGYSNMFDVMPVQEAINALYSAAMTNNNAFAVQNIAVPRGSDIDFSAIPGGMNIIEYNHQVGKPEAINLTATSEETYKFMKTLEQAAETISGINSVARGNPEASLKSGTALALVQSMALQFISGLQRQYVRLIEDVGTGIINTTKIFAAVPRIRQIAGLSNQPFMDAYTGDDLSLINRVTVEVSNPMARTTAGRIQMATELIQYGIITSPEQYFTVLNTGSLDAMTEDSQNELLLVRSENEALSAGKDVMAIATDKHSIHIKNHRSVLGNPELRFNPELLARVNDHILEHIRLLQETDPALLMLLGEQPLQPPGMPQGPEMAGQPAPSNAPQGIDNVNQSQNTGNIQQDEAVVLPDGKKVSTPNMPEPPPIPVPGGG